MPLNISVERKVSLADFGIGWENCYVAVKPATVGVIDAFEKALDGAADAAVTAAYRDFARSVITGAVVLVQDADGSRGERAVGSGEVEEVVQVLDLPALIDVMQVSRGADRLKAITASISSMASTSSTAPTSSQG